MATPPPKKQAPPAQYEEVYNVHRLNWWFVISALALLVTAIWMVADDYTREWKQVQRGFNKAEVTELEARLGETEAAVDAAALEDVQARMAAAEQGLADRRAEVRAAEQELDTLEGAWYRADQEYRFAKAIFDVKRYDFEEARAHGASRAEKLGGEVGELRAKLVDLQDAAKEATRARDGAQSKLDLLTADRDQALAERDALFDDARKIEQRIDELGANFKNQFRNAPLVDFMNPSIKVKQVVIDDLKLDVNFTEIPRTDRCMSCHVTVDTPGYEHHEQPFRTHPNLDLYLASTSAHPMAEFGCTVCHAGRGWGTTFKTAAHTPNNHAQEEEWKEEYGWEEMHHWPHPMRLAAETESACFKCHTEEFHVGGAERLNQARYMYFQAGCYGCHATKGYEGLRRSGPSLERIATKTTPDWAYLWIMDPPAFRPSRMPKFFGLSNTSTPEDEARARVEVGAIVEYLFKHSERGRRYSNSGSGGSARRGEELVNTIGCKGCHAVGNEGVSWGNPRFHGPNLMGTGSKVSAAWLYAWVLDPKQYWEHTRMPDLRLTDQEAKDIVAYLMSLKREGTAGFRRPSIDQEVLKTIALETLGQRATRAEAEAAWSAKSPEEQVEFVGQITISRYGCFGCHDIRGFEDAQPIGTELSQHADKPLFQLDFGFADVHHTRRDFFVNKLKDPRIFDEGRTKAPQDKLKMPAFGFTDEQAELMALNLLSFTKERVAGSKRPERTPAQLSREAGWWPIHENNCIGCHSLDGYGGEIASTLDDEAFAPPMLRHQGAKVNPDWFFQFLKEPSTIRPWLHVRMPTFHFSDPAANEIISFFAGLDGETPSFRGPAAVTAAPRELAEGRQLFDELRCQKCHVLGDQTPGGDPADWAPDLSLARRRLQPAWIDAWLKDPQEELPGTRMPSFFFDFDEDAGEYTPLYPDSEEQVFKIREHLLNLGWLAGKGGGQ